MLDLLILKKSKRIIFKNIWLLFVDCNNKINVARKEFMMKELLRKLSFKMSNFWTSEKKFLYQIIVKIK